MSDVNKRLQKENPDYTIIRVNMNPEKLHESAKKSREKFHTDLKAIYKKSSINCMNTIKARKRRKESRIIGFG